MIGRLKEIRCVEIRGPKNRIPLSSHKLLDGIRIKEIFRRENIKFYKLQEKGNYHTAKDHKSGLASFL